MTKKEQKEIIRQFVKFLKKKDVYIEYKNNLMKDVNGDNYVGFTYGIQLRVLCSPSGSERKFSIYLAEELINYAFCWADTPQGHEFWSELSREWKIYLDENFEELYD